MRKVLSIAAVALFIAGSSAFAGSDGGCSAQKASCCQAKKDSKKCAACKPGKPCPKCAAKKDAKKCGANCAKPCCAKKPASKK